LQKAGKAFFKKSVLYLCCVFNRLTNGYGVKYIERNTNYQTPNTRLHKFRVWAKNIVDAQIGR
jgi:hypothetical protein